MILLDTDVVSALMKPTPIQAVLDWLDGEDAAQLYLSTISIAEIRYGLRILPDGKRRRDLDNRFERFVARGFEHRILGFDERAAHFYGDLMGHRKEIGRPMSILDGQIAAIARARLFAVATGNVRDFEECGLDIVNPFLAAT